MSAWLFCPGHDAKKVGKALESKVNAVVIDWEDAVPQTAKERARQTTDAVLARRREPTPQILVRTNAAGTDEFARDLAAIQSMPVDGLMLPKSESVDEIRRACRLGVRVVALIETALGVERAGQIAGADKNVERLAFGSLDFIADVGGRWDPSGTGFAYARQQVVLCGRARGREAPLDGVWPLLGDIEGLRRDCGTARDIGYGGKMVIHPEQILPVQESFAPTETEIEWARRIVTASRIALAAGETALRLDGQFVDPPIVRRAEEILRHADEVSDE
ncbi:MAG: CoA ester lyase [Trueperaceae bacterium]